MSGWVVVSFYTVDTGYEQEVKKLEASLIQFNLPYKLYPCKPLGSWRKNLDYKSECILAAFSEFPDKDIVFIDADGIVRKHPSLFDELSKSHDYDMAAHFHPYMHGLKEGSLLSGTLWFANTERGRKLVEKWHLIGLAHQDIRHQHCLRLALTEFEIAKAPMRVCHLPRQYTLIFDYYRRNKPEPVIEHFQASRRLRHKVGRGGPLVHSNFVRLAEQPRNPRHKRLVDVDIAAKGRAVSLGRLDKV